MKHYTKSELEAELRRVLPKTTLGNRPINTKTGLPYKRFTKRWWIWYHGLSDNDRNVLADLSM